MRHTLKEIQEDLEWVRSRGQTRVSVDLAALHHLLAIAGAAHRNRESLEMYCEKDLVTAVEEAAKARLFAEDSSALRDVLVTPECPGPDCPYCANEKCAICGDPAPGRPDCEHDVIDRHPK